MTKTYLQIASAIDYFVENQQKQPSLSELAEHVGLSESHIQRLFSEWVGVSPKQFLQFLTKEYAKTLLAEHSVLQTSEILGLSGTSRLHDLMLKCEGMTPGEYKKKGKGIDIKYGVYECPFGLCFISLTEKGVCKLAFMNSEQEEDICLDELQTEWPLANISKSQVEAEAMIAKVFERAGEEPNLKQTLRLILKGTPFQMKVWEALLAIPEGQLWSYQQLADSMGIPESVRAVSSAVARNHIAYLIPCHRVIRSNGALNQYRWGKQRKPVMIGWEMSQARL